MACHQFEDRNQLKEYTGYPVSSILRIMHQQAQFSYLSSVLVRGGGSAPFPCRRSLCVLLPFPWRVQPPLFLLCPTPSPATSVVPNLWCFEVQSLQSQGSRPLVLGVPTLPERREWLERLAQLVVPPTSSGLSARQLHGAPKHAGRLHVKEGTSGFWQTAGVVLRGRSLGVHLPGSGEHVDLRRVMSVGECRPGVTGPGNTELHTHTWY